MVAESALVVPVAKALSRVAPDSSCRMIYEFAMDNLREYAGVLVYENANELFFADKVILCEGCDDFVVRAIAEELFPGALDAKNVTVLSAGGKDNLATLARLVRKLGIECYLVADFDYLLRDKEAAREQYGAPAHESICSLGRGFFAQACSFGPDAQDIVGAIHSEMRYSSPPRQRSERQQAATQ